MPFFSPIHLNVLLCPLVLLFCLISPLLSNISCSVLLHLSCPSSTVLILFCSLIMYCIFSLICCPSLVLSFFSWSVLSLFSSFIPLSLFCPSSPVLSLHLPVALVLFCPNPLHSILLLLSWTSHNVCSIFFFHVLSFTICSRFSPILSFSYSFFISRYVILLLRPSFPLDPFFLFCSFPAKPYVLILQRPSSPVPSLSCLSFRICSLLCLMFHPFLFCPSFPA
jgi:hypothetical protein